MYSGDLHNEKHRYPQPGGQIQTLADLSDPQSRYDHIPVFRYRDRDAIRDISRDDFSADLKRIKTNLNGFFASESRIALLSENSYPMIMAMLSVFGLGKTAVLIDHSDPAEIVLEKLTSVDCHMLLASEECFPVAEKVAADSGGAIRIISLSTVTGVMPELPHDLPSLHKDEDAGDVSETRAIECVIRPDDIAVILFTSGTTGKAKAVPLSHSNLLSGIRCELDTFWNREAASVLPEEAGISTILVLPLHHCFGLACSLLTSLFYGITICINESLRCLRKDIHEFTPAYLCLVPGIIQMLMRRSSNLQEVFGPAVKTIIVGGSPVTKEMEDEFAASGIRLHVGYGITECSPVVSSNSYTGYFPGSTGLPCSCNEVKLLPSGEIVVRGNNVMKGYLNHPNDESVFVDGWFRTGDIGKIGEHGEIYIVGRIKNLIILPNGENVPCEVVEGKICGIPYVKEVLVYEKDGKITAECYCPEQGKEILELLTADIEKINAAMPQTHAVTQVLLRETEFPRTSSGKIKRVF